MRTERIQRAPTLLHKRTLTHCPVPRDTEDIRDGGKLGKGSHLRCHTDELGLQVWGSTWGEENSALATVIPTLGTGPGEAGCLPRADVKVTRSLSRDGLKEAPSPTGLSSPSL